MREILGLAHAGRVPCLLGSTLEFGIGSAFMTHIGVSAPSVDGPVPSDIVGLYYHERDVIKERFVMENGAIRPPDEPRLGVTLDNRTVKAYRADRG